MAAHSNRSPSPLCSRPTNPNLRNSDPNPNLRNPETNSANRRSFSGNKPFSKPSVLTNSRRFDPTTPANSPSDIASRRSVSEEKENYEKEDSLKASKLQSPSKGCKHFMSPTISAASKFTPSPRKKVLVERNDPVRTSISLSDGKAMFFSSMSPIVDPKSETGYQNQKIEGHLDSKVADLAKIKAVHEGHPVSKPSKRVSFSDVPPESHLESESQSESVVTDSNTLKLDSVVADSDSLKLDSNLKNEVDSPHIAPLDADPLLPPYDPKSNYLSPRPQFLLYKPNPRIGILLNKEIEVDDPEGFRNNLLEEIMSENLSDSSEGSEESQTEDSSSQNEEIEVTNEDMVIGMDEMEADDHISATPDLLPISTPVDNVVSKEDPVQKIVKKPRAFFRVMCFSTLLMLFFVAFVSISCITYSPHEFVQKDVILSDLSNLYHQSRAAAKVEFDRFSARVDQLKTSSVSYLSKLASELGKGGGEQAPMQFLNLSDLQVENTWSEGFFINKGTEGLMENLEDDELDVDMDTYEEVEEHEEIDFDEKEYDSQDDDILEAESDTFGEEETYETFEEGINAEEENSPDSVKSSNEKSKSGHSQDTKIQREAIDTKQLGEQNTVDQSASRVEAPLEGTTTDPASSASTDSNFLDHKSESDVNTLSEEGVESSLEDNSFAQKAMGVSSLFAALLAAVAFMYHHKRKQQPSSAPLMSKEGTKQQYIHQEKEQPQNWQTEVDEIGSESCPSAMSSSFQKSASSYSSKRREANEAVSSERKSRKIYKRESLASSSEFSAGSPSYGSFTTYERIHIKHGNGEDEIVTPVRRSSRIRNHHHDQVFTSP